MFGISSGELMVIAIVGLLLFGPERLPELARSYGKFMAQFNQTLESVQQEFHKGLESAENSAETAVATVDNTLESTTAIPPSSQIPEQNSGSVH